jgi:hypothetical protein
MKLKEFSPPCRYPGFKSGQELAIKASGGIITIVPKLPDVDEEYTLAERRALAGPFATAEEFVADLHRKKAKLTAKTHNPPRK